MVQFDDTYDKEKLEEFRREEEEHLLRGLAAQSGYQYVYLPGITINPSALIVIDEKVARAAFAAAFERQHKLLTIAVNNPNLPATATLLEDLKNKGYKITIMLASHLSLEHAWNRYQDQKNTVAVTRGVLDINPDTIAATMRSLRSREDVTAKIEDIRTINSARRVSETLETMFAGALALHASDIHIEPEAAGVRLRYRLDGVLHDIIDMQQIIYERLISRLKLLAGMRLNAHNEAQDGRFTFTIGEQTVEVRASIIPGAAGESMVMRLLDPGVASFTFENLGLNPVLSDIIMDELKRPNGLIITTGPTGSGKTTALYSFLRQVHNSDTKIITIEDPVEYKLEGIVQTQVSDEYSFASGLRAIMRQDPDVIMVGEIRDSEVAETALQAAKTGHLVFSTLHTNSAVGAFPRLIDLGADYRSFGSSINVVLGQRLVRILCSHCKKSFVASEDETRLIKEALLKHPKPPVLTNPINIYKPVGCEYCNQSGFSGRQGIYEAVLMDTAVEEAILRDPREHIIAAAAEPQKIPTMVHDGIEKVLSGITSLDELVRVVDIENRRQKNITDEDNSDLPDISEHIV